MVQVVTRRLVLGGRSAMWSRRLAGWRQVPKGGRRVPTCECALTHAHNTKENVLIFFDHSHAQRK